MDAVLPLTLTDLERAGVLLESLTRRVTGLGAIWVVAPDLEARIVEHYLSSFRPVLEVRVVPETRIVPELRLTPRLRGWFRQQLVKLAIHAHVETDLYLTLDADVVCTKRLHAPALGRDGRAPCHVILRDLHPDWYEASEAVLDLRGARRGVLHNVTPAVLHRRGVAELAAYLELRAERNVVSSGLRGMKQKLALARARRDRKGSYEGWRLLLAGGAPWTEYALYYTFLEATGRFEQFHEYGACIYDVERSLWRADRDRFDAWDPAPSFVGRDAPWFLVVQSNTAIAVARVRAKLESCAHGG